jgi:hypothetical protein
MVLFCLHLKSVSQDSLPLNYTKRKALVISSSAAFSAGSLLYLNRAWYSQYNTGKFHFFNDNHEWFQMDKAGHVFTTYQTGRLMMEAFDWAGYTRKQKLIYGNTYGFAYLAIIELMDGYSDGWGFSWGDVAANAIGTGMSLSQEYLWKEQKIHLKYSYRKSGLAGYNPNLLGKNFSEKLLKDYNAQAYWLSFNPFYLLNSKTTFPHWLCLSLGYGGSGMIRSKDNFITYTTASTPNVAYYFETDRYRNVYVSLDVDFKKIKTKSKVLKTVFSCLNMVKVPFPTIDINKNGIKLLPLR